MIGTSLRIRIALLLLVFSMAMLPASVRPRHADVNSLSKNAREIFLTSMKWSDQAWDPQAKLCRAPASTIPAESRRQGATYFMVRDSTWYALGLLLRDGPGDRTRAEEILRTALKAQYHEPGKRWDGTFRRSPDEPEPGPNAVMWRDYDPNWREFIGTTFAEILEEFPDRIPADLAHDMTNSIVDAVAGEIKEGRLARTYTNPALMLGFLWSYAAVRGHRPDWIEPAAKWQQDVYNLYKQHDAFYEYNSPTYAGVDVFALALWRDYGFTPEMRRMGSEMEAGLWRVTADFYNADLRNISGPYDRSYGMDMQSYVSVMGLWLRTVLDADKAPLVGFDHPPVDHVADLWFVPALVVLDTQIPADAMKSFRALQGEHSVRRPIADQRIATAWIGKNLIYGGEITGHTRGVDARSQFHPVTVQWQAPGRIGWIQLTQCPPIDAAADRQGILITADGDVAFRISAPGISSSDAKAGKWTLPGLTVLVESDSKNFTAEQHGEFVDVKYSGITRMKMTIRSSGG